MQQIYIIGAQTILVNVKDYRVARLEDSNVSMFLFTLYIDTR